MAIALTNKQRTWLDCIISTEAKRTAWLNVSELVMVEAILKAGVYNKPQQSELNEIVRYYTDRLSNNTEYLKSQDLLIEPSKLI